MNVNYYEFQPSAVLQPFVDCYWIKTFETDQFDETSTQSCLPLGTMELIFCVNNGSCHVMIDEKWEKLPSAYVVGLYRNTVIWSATGNTIKFGIRLKPESLLRLFKIPAASLFNTFTDLEVFFGKEIYRFADQILGTTDPSTLIQIAETFLGKQLRNLKTERNYAFEASQIIRQAKGTLSIESLSEHVYISKRQLERSFKDQFGTSPKTYMRIIRFRNAYQQMQQISDSSPNWMEIIHKHGYADQAHFIRDFKEFTGDVPTSMLQKGHYYYQLNQHSQLSLA